MQEADSRVGRLVGVVGAGLPDVVEQLRRELRAAVGNIDQQGAVGAQRIGRAQQHDIGRRLDPALRVARRLVDVGDDRVARVGRVDRNGGARRDLHIGTDAAEASALERRTALQHFEADHLRVGRQSKEEGREKRGDA